MRYPAPDLALSLTDGRGIAEAELMAMALTYLFSFLGAAFPPLLLAPEAAQAQGKRRVPPAPGNSGACADQAWTNAVSRTTSCAAASVPLNVPGGAATAAAGEDPGLSSGSSAAGNLELDVGAGGGAVAEGETTKAPIQSSFGRHSIRLGDGPRHRPPAFEDARKKPFQDASRDAAKDLVPTGGARIERYEPGGRELRSRPAPPGG